MSDETARGLIAAASASPLSRRGVRYPRWYLQRWHFLPEGYLSRRSIHGYDRLIRRLYNVASESSILSTVARSVAERSPSSVAEIGCGTGRLLSALRARLPDSQLIGVDLSPFMLESARERLADADVELIHANALRSPLPSAQFDAVVAMHVLGHMPARAGAAAASEALRMLKPGGRLWLVDHSWHPLPLGTASSSIPLLGGLQRLHEFELHVATDLPALA